MRKILAFGTMIFLLVVVSSIVMAEEPIDMVETLPDSNLLDGYFEDRYEEISREVLRINPLGETAGNPTAAKPEDADPSKAVTTPPPSPPTKEKKQYFNNMFGVSPEYKNFKDDVKAAKTKKEKDEIAKAYLEGKKYNYKFMEMVLDILFPSLGDEVAANWINDKLNIDYSGLMRNDAYADIIDAVGQVANAEHNFCMKKARSSFFVMETPGNYAGGLNYPRFEGNSVAYVYGKRLEYKGQDGKPINENGMFYDIDNNLLGYAYRLSAYFSYPDMDEYAEDEIDYWIVLFKGNEAFPGEDRTFKREDGYLKIDLGFYDENKFDRICLEFEDYRYMRDSNYFPYDCIVEGGDVLGSIKESKTDIDPNFNYFPSFDEEEIEDEEDLQSPNLGSPQQGTGSKSKGKW